MDAQLELRLALCEGLSVVVCFVVGLSCAYKWAAFSCRRKHMAQLAGAPFSQTFAIAWFSIYVSVEHATLRKHMRRTFQRHKLTCGSFLAQPVTPLVSRGIIYFGLPKSITLGYQVGRVLPATCEASLAVEGPDGLPCSLRRLMQWASRALSDRETHLDDFEALWRRKFVIWGLFTLLWLAVPVVVHVFAMRESREDQRNAKAAGTNVHPRKIGKDEVQAVKMA